MCGWSKLGHRCLVVTVTFDFNGAGAGKPITLSVNHSVAVASNVAVPGFKLWTVGQGNLFTLQVTDTTTNDALLVRSGIRIVSTNTTSGRLLINGEPVKLLGVNRHTMWPDTGAAVTVEQEKSDVQLLQQLNANYVRGAHYPQSQSFLDMCDEAGIAIWYRRDYSTDLLLFL